MTEEEYFIKNYPDSCYGNKPLSPHWDFFQDGVEFGERKSEKQIEIDAKQIRALQKQNGELTDKVKELEEEVADLQLGISIRNEDMEKLEAQVENQKNRIKVFKGIRKELNEKIHNLESVAEIRLANWQKYEKENAELKKKVENLQKYLDTRNCYRECAETWLKLTEAKKLLKQFLEAKNGEDTYKAEFEAEQFLNSEVEK